MSFLGDALGFEGFHSKRIGKALLDNPTRLLTGVDPLSTWGWNKVLGTHNKPIVDQMGGATGADYKAASNAGINTTAGHDMQDLAHVVAAYYGTAGLGGIGGAGAGAGADAGVGAGAGAGSVGEGAGSLGTASGFGGVGTDAGATGFGAWGTSAGGADVGGLAAADSAAVDAQGAAPGLTDGYGSASSGVNYQQLIGKALGQMGQSKSGQGGGGRPNPVNVQPGNVPYNFMGGY